MEILTLKGAGAAAEPDALERVLRVFAFDTGGKRFAVPDDDVVAALKAFDDQYRQRVITLLGTGRENVVYVVTFKDDAVPLLRSALEALVGLQPGVLNAAMRTDSRNRDTRSALLVEAEAAVTEDQLRALTDRTVAALGGTLGDMKSDYYGTSARFHAWAKLVDHDFDTDRLAHVSPGAGLDRRLAEVITAYPDNVEQLLASLAAADPGNAPRSFGR